MPVAARRHADDYDVSTVEILKRIDATRDAVASAAIEGIKVEDKTRLLLEQFTSGAIGEDELIEQGLKMYGPGA